MKISLIILAILACACGSLLQEQDEHGNSPPQPGASQTNFVPSPDYRVPLETVRDTGLPYVSEAAAAALALLSLYAGIRNRRLRKTAMMLTRNIAALNPTPEAIATIKAAQDGAGVRDEVRKLLAAD